MQPGAAGSRLRGFLPSVSAAFRGCWWFSLVAAASGGDTLIEPHYFQVCGTLRGHRSRGVPCVFNYCCDRKECDLSHVQVSITTPDGCPQTKPTGPFPAEHVAVNRVCGAGRSGEGTGLGGEGPIRGLINPSGKCRQRVPIRLGIALWGVIGRGAASGSPASRRTRFRIPGGCGGPGMRSYCTGLAGAQYMLNVCT